MSKVSEFMNTDVISVHPDDELEKVVKIFKDSNVNGLPVVDTDNKVVGIVSARDLLQYSEKTNTILFPYFPDWIPPYDYLLDAAAYKSSVEGFLKTKVYEVMNKKVVTIGDHTSWHDAAYYMKKKGVNRLPIVDSEGKLKGIVARTDLLNFLAEHEEV